MFSKKSDYHPTISSLLSELKMLSVQRVSEPSALRWRRFAVLTLRARHFSKNKGLIQFNQMKNWHTPNYRFGKSEGERQYIRRKLIFFFLISIVVLIDCISKNFEKKLQKYQYCIIIFVLLQSLSVMLKLLLRLSYCDGTHTYKRRFLDALVLTL